MAFNDSTSGRWAAGAAVAVVILAIGAPSLAGETIFDPENPAFDDDGDDGSEEDDDGDSQQDDGEDDGSETIFDPERPDFGAPEPAEDESEDSDGPDEDAAQAGDGDQGTGFRDTAWNLNYELATLVDPGFGPEGYDALEIAGGLGMELRHDMSEQTRAVVSGRFSYWAGAGREFDQWRTVYEPRLERAYLRHRIDRWSLAFGQMRNSWGSTDLVRPGDVIDPVDLRDPRGGAGLGTSAGQLSATATYSADDWSLRAVLVPFFQSNRISIFGRDTSLIHDRNPVVGEQLPLLLFTEQLLDEQVHLDSDPFVQATRRPLETPRNISGGLRGTTTVSGTDLGLGLYVGWDRTPWVDLDEEFRRLLEAAAEAGFDEEFQQENGEEQFDDVDGSGIDSGFYRRATLVADVARYVGPIGVRADVALSPRQVFYTDEFAPVRRPSVFSALGLSYERLLDGVRPLSLTMEGFWLHPFAADSPVTQLTVPDEQRGSEDDELLLFDGGYYGVAGAVNWATGWWDLEVSSGVVASISPGDLIGQLSIERRWRPGIRTTLGSNLFFGPDPAERLTLGGQWAHASRLYLAVGGEF